MNTQDVNENASPMPAPENTQQAAPVGNSAEKTLFCSKCGRQLLPDSRFCNYCAAPVVTAMGTADTTGTIGAANFTGGQQTYGGAFQQNTYAANNFAQGAVNGYPYQQQYPSFNAQPGGMGMGMGGFASPMVSPLATDPRFNQFQKSALQPGQREIVRCTQVSKSYGNNNALSAIDLVIGSGRVIGLLGPNGSGKTTLIKLICGLLTPTTGTITVNGVPIGAATKAMVSYLPDRTYIQDWMKIRNILDYFSDFYADFRRPLAETMLANLHIDPEAVMKTLSKGTQEKVQLVLVMSRNASLYLLDEPIAGVDPVARDYILDTIIRAHNPDSSVVISTHLITDIEPVLNEVIMIKYGTLALHGDADLLRNTFGKSLNDIFKEVFAGC